MPSILTPPQRSSCSTARSDQPRSPRGERVVLGQRQAAAPLSLQKLLGTRGSRRVLSTGTRCSYAFLRAALQPAEGMALSGLRAVDARDRALRRTRGAIAAVAAGAAAASGLLSVVAAQAFKGHAQRTPAPAPRDSARTSK